jgi:uncharacterized protein (DUF1697 family)
MVAALAVRADLEGPPGVSDGPTHAAFLRGVNLGPNRRVSADQLRSILGDLGFEHADSFRTSGNAVFAAARESRGKLATRLEGGLEKELGFDVRVFLRTAAEVRSIATHDPFPGEEGGKLQVYLLGGKPSAKLSKEVLALGDESGERLEFAASELYWLPAGPTMESQPFLKALGKALEDAYTQRTMQTMQKLAEKYFPG